MGQRNRVLLVDEIQIPVGRGILIGEGTAHFKVWLLSAVSFTKMAERIKMPFGIWTRSEPKEAW